MGTGDEQVTQETMFLHPYQCEVPVLHTEEANYVPIRALCDMLGLPAKIYIGATCRKYREESLVCRLPVRLSEGKVKLEWCLDQLHVAKWVVEIPSHRVSPKIRARHLAFQEDATSAVTRVYQDQHSHYRTEREALYDTLVRADAMQRRLQRMFHHFRISLKDTSARTELEELSARMDMVFDELGREGKRLADEMENQMIIDGIKVDEAGNIVDVVSMPLLPAVPDVSIFAACMQRFDACLGEFETWVGQHRSR